MWLSGSREEQGGEGAVGLKNLNPSPAPTSCTISCLEIPGVLLCGEEMLIKTIANYQLWWIAVCALESGLEFLNQLWLLGQEVAVAAILSSLNLRMEDWTLGSSQCCNRALVHCECIHCGQERSEQNAGPSIPFSRMLLVLSSNLFLPLWSRLCSNWPLQRFWVKPKFFSKLVFPPLACHWLGELR